MDLDGEKCILAITHNITDRLLAQERFRTLFESANDAIYIRDEEGRFLEVNRTACDHLGYTRDELLGMSVADIDTPEFAATLPTRSRSILEHGSGFFETTHVRRDGTTMPVEISATVLDDGDRKVILSISRDISERKRAETERAILEEQLHQAAKEESIGRLAGGIAHDFNNLLTAIRGYTNLALAELPPGEGPRQDLEQVDQAADRATGLTRQLLAFARKTELEPRVVDLGEIVEHLKPMLERLIGEDVKLVTLAQGRGAWVMADPGKIEQDDRDLHLVRTLRRGASYENALGAGYRRRHERRDTLSPVRALLHHEASGRGHRPRTGHGLGHRPSVQRDCSGGERDRQGFDFHNLTPGHRAARGPRRVASVGNGAPRVRLRHYSRRRR
jgi:PAS domain S-box-containing protein